MVGMGAAPAGLGFRLARMPLDAISGMSIARFFYVVKAEKTPQEERERMKSAISYHPPRRTPRSQCGAYYDMYDNTNLPDAPLSTAQVTRNTPVATISVIYFGTTGAFSAPPLEALLRAGYDVRAVVLAALDRAQPIRRVPVTKATPRGRSLPLLATLGDQNIVALATERKIPVWEVGDLRASATRETLAGYAPDALCVACFARKLPASVLSLPRLGALNVHPSLLPDNRGPDPLFWTFWRGDEATGVTIHLMDERLDTGPILTQQGEPIPEGVTEAALEARLATLGGELLARSLDTLADGSAHPQPQDESQATSFPWPTEGDYRRNVRLAGAARLSLPDRYSATLRASAHHTRRRDLRDWRGAWLRGAGAARRALATGGRSADGAPLARRPARHDQALIWLASMAAYRRFSGAL